MDAASESTLVHREGIPSDSETREERTRMRSISSDFDDERFEIILCEEGAPTQPEQEHLCHSDYQIALYYCYIPINNPSSHVEFQRSLCEHLNLNGRIRVALEGINGVLSGKQTLLKEYAEALRNELHTITPQNEGDSSWELDVKFCNLRTDLPVLDQLFDTLSVKQTKSVVSLVGTSSSENASSSGKKRKNRKQQRKKNAQKENEAKNGSVSVNVETTPVNNDTEAAARYTERIYASGLRNMQPASHLSPTEWNFALTQQATKAAQEDPNATGKKTILLDCRNVYESNVGRFEAPGVDTMLTNTRKFSELPHVLVQQKERLQEADQIFMYCTGGVRCERASVFLQSLLSSDGDQNEGKSNDKTQDQSTTNTKKKSTPQVYQLHGGIQRYLESAIPSAQSTSASSSQSPSLFRGKNFVFDPRRTDPLHDGTIVGTCLVCQAPHDDFDLGASPAQNGETRCWNCRILVLVCPACRPTVSCWNDPEETDNEMNGSSQQQSKPRLYCGGNECFHMPPVQIVSGGEKKKETH